MKKNKVKQFGILVAIAAALVALVLFESAAPHVLTSRQGCGNCKCSRTSAAMSEVMSGETMVLPYPLVRVSWE